MTQGSFITGYVRIRVEGLHAEKFFQTCIDNNIKVWDIKKESRMICSGNISLKHVGLIKKMNRSFNYKIKFKEKLGLPFLVRQFLNKKEILIALVLSVLLVVFLSNIVWKIEIKGVPKDLEEKINKQLKGYGVHQGAWTFTLDTSGDIQRKLESDIADLLWIGVHKKGTTYVLEGVEKSVVEKDKVKGPRDLVATKKGVIQKMYVSEGKPLVSIHDYVEPGDLLVSGNLVDNTADTDKGESEKDPIYVVSEGEIIANTWYEAVVSIPLKSKKEIVTGKQKRRYFLNINEMNIPIWGFRSPDFKEQKVENKREPIRFLKWELPMNIMESTINEKVKVDQTKNEKEAIEIGKKQAEKELQTQLGPKAVIKSNKVLHQANENGKVRLKLHISVEENIVKEKPIKK